MSTADEILTVSPTPTLTGSPIPTKNADLKDDLAKPELGKQSPFFHHHLSSYYSSLYSYISWIGHGRRSFHRQFSKWGPRESPKLASIGKVVLYFRGFRHHFLYRLVRVFVLFMVCSCSDSMPVHRPLIREQNSR
jgi:hypothetical protein